MIWRWSITLVAVMAAVHLILGSDPIAVLLVTLTTLLGLGPLMVCGFRNIGAVLVALFALRYVGFAAVFKLLDGSTFESGLYVPILSLSVVLVGVTAMVLAFALSNLVPVGHAWFKPIQDPYFLLRLAVGSATIGVGAYSAGALLPLPETLDNALRILTPFAMLAIVASTAACILKSGGRRTINLLTAALLAMFVLNSLWTNTRHGILVAAIAFLVTCVAFRKKFRRVQIVLGVLAAFVFVAGLSPAMIEVRKYRAVMTPLQLAEVTVTTTIDRLFGSSKAPAVEDNLRARYQLYFHRHTGTSLERFAIVQQADIIIAVVDGGNSLGYRYVIGNLGNMLPSFLNAEKNPLGHADYLFWHYGLLPWGLTAHLSASFLGEAFAIAKWEGVIVFAFVIPFVWFLVFRKLANDPLYNIWSVYFFVRFIHTFTEQDVNTNIYALLRGLPTDLVLIAILLGVLHLVRNMGRQYGFPSRRRRNIPLHWRSRPESRRG